jgi:hypothetical protein
MTQFLVGRGCLKIVMHLQTCRLIFCTIHQLTKGLWMCLLKCSLESLVSSLLREVLFGLGALSI